MVGPGRAVPHGEAKRPWPTRGAREEGNRSGQEIPEGRNGAHRQRRMSGTFRAMSWLMDFAGARAAVGRAVKSCQRLDECSAFDRARIERVKSFVIAEIDALPSTVTGVHVQVSAREDGWSLRVKVRAVALELGAVGSATVEEVAVEDSLIEGGPTR